MYDLVHVTPLGDATTQLPFIRACRQRGAKRISAGTGLVNAQEQPQAVRAVLEETDYFFMNDLETKAVFGSLDLARTEAGKVLYVTLGAQGACIIQGDCSTFIPAVPATVLDPTGAGDTFCGATLAYLLQNNHPIMAARHVPAAGETPADRLVVVLHAGRKPVEVKLPDPLHGRCWRVCLDTSEETGDAGETIYRTGDAITVPARSVVVLEDCADHAERRTAPRSAPPQDLLNRLTRGAGIAADWHDIDGTRHVVTDATKRALLAAMGYPADSAPQVREKPRVRQQTGLVNVRDFHHRATERLPLPPAPVGVP